MFKYTIYIIFLVLHIQKLFKFLINIYNSCHVFLYIHILKYILQIRNNLKFLTVSCKICKVFVYVAKSCNLVKKTCNIYYG